MKHKTQKNDLQRVAKSVS